MTFQVSPGQEVLEIDATASIPAVSTSIGGFVGDFQWGPVNQVSLVTDESDLVRKFGGPKSSSSTAFMVASQFLSYSSALKVVRAEDSAAAKNANESGASNIFVGNQNDIDSGAVDLTTGGVVIARYPGDFGNSLKVVVLDDVNYDVNNADPDVAAVSKLFDSAPSAGEYHIAVYDTAGVFTGTVGSVLETYEYLSANAGTKAEDGSNIYYVDVINQQSDFIIIGDTGTFAAGVFNMSGGLDTTVGDAELQLGWDKFTADIDVSILIAGAVSSTTAAYITNLAIARKDCIVTISPEKADVVTSTDPLTDVLAFRTSMNLNTSYAVMDNNWKYTFNKYLDRFEWVPTCADVAGLMARTDSTNDPWFSPAGYNRGVLKNVIKLAWLTERAHRDELYKLGVNAIVNEPGTGPVLFGDKTLLARPSAFDRINVRRLFIVLEKAISTASKFNLFELNDQFTRANFVATVEPFLREVQGRRGVEDFKVICDETNNTAQVINSNQFVGDIYIKPARSVNFITLRFTAVRSGVEFSEIIGQA